MNQSLYKHLVASGVISMGILFRRSEHCVGLVKLAVKNELRRKGYDRKERLSLVDDIDKVNIASAAIQAKVEVPYLNDSEDTREGDHPIIDAIIAFLNSEAGKALIQALISLLLGLI